MYNITIFERGKRIEISKQFAEKAKFFGSDAQKELAQAKKQYPTFRVVVKHGKRETNLKNKISTKDMELYIRNHSGIDSKQMKEFLDLRGTSIKDAGSRCDAIESAHIQVLKEWFFNTYPELDNKEEKRKKHINEILANAKTQATTEATSNVASV